MKYANATMNIQTIDRAKFLPIGPTPSRSKEPRPNDKIIPDKIIAINAIKEETSLAK